MTDYVPLTFGLESLYPPMALPSPLLRSFYMKVAEPCRFTEFRQLGEGQGARLAEGSNRHITITNDRIVYRDEFTQHMFSTFTEDVVQILRALREVFQIPVLLHSKVLTRLLMPYRGEGNVQDYLQKHLINEKVGNVQDAFSRGLSGVGIRLVFPPTQEQHSTFNLRIEPYYRDLKMFFLENSAQFFDPIVNFEDSKKILEQTYLFVKDQVGPFILQLSSPST